MAGDDLEGALTSQVQAGEDGQDGLGKVKNGDGNSEVRTVDRIVKIHHSEAESSSDQRESRSEDSEKMTTGEKTIQTSSRTDRSGHSVLQTLGQAQGGGDDGGGVGCEEYNSSIEECGVINKYDVA